MNRFKMIVDVICPGPSAGDYDGAGEVCVGVNRAVELVPCDVWVWLDGEMFGEVEPIGSPRVITSKAGHRRACKQGGNDRLVRLGFELVDSEAKTPPHWEIPWSRYSSTTAILSAIDMGATQIYVWGADMRGVADWDGETRDRDTRTNERWKSERQILARLMRWARNKGIRIKRRGLA